MENLDQLLDWCKQTFWRRRDHVAESTGTQQAGLPVVLNSLGKLAISLLTPLVGDLTITGFLKALKLNVADGTHANQGSYTGFFGSTLKDYTPTSGNWNTTESTILLNGLNYTVISFHDSGARVDCIRVGGGLMVIGYDAGWGSPAVSIPGAVGIGTNPGSYKLDVIQAGGAGVGVFRAGQNGVSNGYTILSDGSRLTHAWDGAFGAWNNLSYGSGWQDFNASSWQSGQYRKIGDLVYLRGLVARASGVGATIATLPAGHWPPAPILHAVNATDAHGRIDIATNGVMSLAAGTPTYVSLNDIPPFCIY